MIQNKTICVVGLGLMGGSCAMALNAAGATVTAIDTNKDSIAFALQNNFIKDGETENPSRLLQKADYVLLALYPRVLLEWLGENARYIHPKCIVTDVTGIKRSIVQTAQSLMPVGAEFIGCHPMAGREVYGVQNAKETLFCGANFIITPTELNSNRAIAFAKELGATLKSGKISLLTCEQHDKMIGYVSQLTHAIAVSLMNANDNTHLVEYTGDSFRDLTRIANINDAMWSELFLMNSDILITEIDDFIKELSRLKATLETNDEPALREMFVKSSARRKLFDKQKT